MTFERSHFCESTPKGSGCTVIGEYSFVDVSIEDVALTSWGSSTTGASATTSGTRGWLSDERREASGTRKR